MFALFRLRSAAVGAAVAFLLAGVILAGLYLWSPHATLRVTTGLPGTTAQRFISSFVAVITAQHPRVHFELVPAGSLAESSQAMEAGKVNLALVRTDVSPPTNGRTIAILRRDVFAIFLPHGSAISNPSQLTGKTVAIPEGPTQDNNSRSLNSILSYFDVAPAKVKRLFLPAAEIGPALRRKEASAALAVGPIGPGDAVTVAASIFKATRAAPALMAFDQADAIIKRFPASSRSTCPKAPSRAGHQSPTTP